MFFEKLLSDGDDDRVLTCFVDDYKNETEKTKPSWSGDNDWRRDAAGG